MIRELTAIKNSSIISQGTESELLSISNIKFNSESVGSGMFGDVFNVLEVNNNQTSRYVLKTFKKEVDTQAYETIKHLHEKIKREQLNKQTSIYQEYPELLGLPFAVFRATDTILNEEVLALLMFNLNELGYIDYGQDNRDEFAFVDLELSLRLLPGYQLARGMAFLHRLLFIHADINEAAIWFNQSKLQLSLIDFDSGYNYDKQEKASTFGKLTHWATAGMRRIIRFGKSGELTAEERIAEENWNFACALFEMLLGRPPFYFLIDEEEETINKYLNKNEWPNIEKARKVINEKSIPAQQEIIELLSLYEENGFGSITELFRKTFNDGHSKISKRATVHQWEKILGKIVKELELVPAITEFYSDKQIIAKKGESVFLNWRSELTNYITINDRAMPLFSQSFSLLIDDTSNITLKAINSISESSKTLTVSAKRIQPVFKSLISSAEIRTTEDPIIISWDAKHTSKVKIEGINISFSARDQIAVHPTQKTIYRIIAYGFFDQPVEKTISVDVIYPVIKDFNWNVDINKGIDNVKLFWETESTIECEIVPMINKVPANGEIDYKINTKTEFELIATGLYGQAKRKIVAVPFCAPIIETIFMKAPPIEISTHVDVRPLEINAELPEILFNSTQLNVNLDFQTHLTPNEVIFNTILPEFTNNNLLIPKLKTSWFSSGYQKFKQKYIKSISNPNLN